MDELFSVLKEFIKETRKNKEVKSFFSDYEFGCSEGMDNVINELEVLINQYTKNI